MKHRLLISIIFIHYTAFANSTTASQNYWPQFIARCTISSIAGGTGMGVGIVIHNYLKNRLSFYPAVAVASMIGDVTAAIVDNLCDNEPNHVAGALGAGIVVLAVKEYNKLKTTTGQK